MPTCPVHGDAECQCHCRVQKLEAIAQAHLQIPGQSAPGKAHWWFTNMPHLACMDAKLPCDYTEAAFSHAHAACEKEGKPFQLV